MTAESAGAGMGSTFTIYLPARDAQAYAISSIPSVDRRREARTVDLEGTHVLIVDDERDARELLRAMLATTGARITEADSAREALRIVSQDWPDLVLADIAMPGQDGYALMRSMRELSDTNAHCIRAIAVSAYARLEDKQLAERAGFNEHLAKPIHREELFETIERLWVH